MALMNCWNFKKCGRQLGGKKVHELGLCPTSIESRVDGINRGFKGGRACWAIAGTLCNDTIQGDYTEKFMDCIHCEFYALVRKEEGSFYVGSQEIVKKLQQRY